MKSNLSAATIIPQPVSDIQESEVRSLAQLPPVRVHMEVRRSWRSVFPGLLAFLFVCGIAVPLSRRLPVLLLDWSTEIFGYQLEVHMPIMGLLAAVLLIRPLFLMYDSLYLVTSHHVKATTGRCSLRRIDVEIAYEDVRGVSISQSILQRILSVGNLRIWTALSSSPEMLMRGIGNPKVVADTIRSQIDQNRIERHHVIADEVASVL